MKNLLLLLMIISAGIVSSCNQNAGAGKKNSDSAVSGLEGTRDEASQLSNATIDTSSGQSAKKTFKDSSYVKDSVPVR